MPVAGVDHGEQGGDQADIHIGGNRRSRTPDGGRAGHRAGAAAAGVTAANHHHPSRSKWPPPGGQCAADGEDRDAEEFDCRAGGSWLRRSEAAAARVSRTKTSPARRSKRAMPASRFARAVAVLDPLPARRATASPPSRPKPPTWRRRASRLRAWLEEADAPLDAVAATVSAGAAGTAADGEAFHAHREIQFHDFRIGQARIGHVAVHRAGAGEGRPRPGAAAHGLVILPRGVAEGEVVHGALGSGQGAERAVQRIDDVLRGFHIARHDGRRVGRIEQADAGGRRISSGRRTPALSGMSRRSGCGRHRARRNGRCWPGR